MDGFLAAVGRLLGGWPADYVAFDCETNGKDPMSDGVLPLQLGWTVVEGGVAAPPEEVFLDWTRPEYGVDPGWLDASIAEAAAGMAKSGKSYHCSVARLRDEGVDPASALRVLRDLLGDALAAGYRVAGHNALYFDRPILERSFRRHAKAPLAIPPEAMVDTCLIEKARRLKLAVDPPGAGALAAWYSAVRRDWRSTRCSLDDACAKAYGYDVDPARAHGAGYDTVLQHRLLEAMRAGRLAPAPPPKRRRAAR